MKTFLKWPGGKEKELPVIRKYTPEYSGRYVEPFVGGGAAFFDTECDKCCINDKSSELMDLYICIKNQDDDLKSFLMKEIDEFNSIGNLIDNNHKEILDLYHSKLSIENFIQNHYDFFSSLASECNDVFLKEIHKNLKSKISRSQKLESNKGEIPNSDRIDNIESALKSAYYMYIRYLLNNSQNLSLGKRSAVFFFVREYCYSSMFRYNKNGAFNVPYGGISYNRKDFQKKANYLFSKELYHKLSNTYIQCKDFEEFMNELNLSANDFIFLDPPYDSDFSTYAQNKFEKEEQIRLCEYLKTTKAKFLLIIKNTDFIYNLYKDDFNITSFDKKYLVSFMSRNDKKAEHLVITNY